MKTLCQWGTWRVVVDRLNWNRAGGQWSCTFVTQGRRWKYQLQRTSAVNNAPAQQANTKNWGKKTAHVDTTWQFTCFVLAINKATDDPTLVYCTHHALDLVFWNVLNINIANTCHYLLHNHHHQHNHHHRHHHHPFCSFAFHEDQPAGGAFEPGVRFPLFFLRSTLSRSTVQEFEQVEHISFIRIYDQLFKLSYAQPIQFLSA